MDPFFHVLLWTLENLKALDIHFIQQPDASENNYLEKLETQLALTAPKVKKLTAGMLGVMFLCPSNLTPNKKTGGHRHHLPLVWRRSHVLFTSTRR